MLKCYRNIGCYNWLNESEKSAYLVVQLPKDAPFERKIMDANVEINSDYDYHGDDPFDMAEAIERYTTACLYSSTKKETQDKLKWIKENETNLRIAEIKYKLELHREKIRKLEGELEYWEEEQLNTFEKGNVSD